MSTKNKPKTKRAPPRRARSSRRPKAAAPTVPFQLPASREEWLERASQILLPFVRQAASWRGVSTALTVPPRVSCSWLPGRNTKALAMTMPNEATGVLEITISPLLGRGWEQHGFKGDHTVATLGHLLHELIHCVVGLDEGHRGAFPAVAEMVGLEAPYSQPSVGEQLLPQLEEQVIHRLGEYPHDSMVQPVKRGGQQNRQRKWVCEHCGKIVRAAGSLEALHLCGDGQQGRFIAA